MLYSDLKSKYLKGFLHVNMVLNELSYNKSIIYVTVKFRKLYEWAYSVGGGSGGVTPSLNPRYPPPPLPNLVSEYPIQKFIVSPKERGLKVALKKNTFGNSVLHEPPL